MGTQQNIPVYMQIINDIEEGIRSGRLKPNDRLPTEAEYSKQFNASRTTVVKALDTLTERQVIYRVRGSGSYVGSAGANDRQKSNIISFVINAIPDYEARGESVLIRGCERYASSNGFYTAVTFTERNLSNQIDVINACKRDLCRGIVYLPDEALIKDNLQQYLDTVLDDFPIVQLSDIYSIKGCSYVLSDNVYGGYIAARHLLECGYDQLFILLDSLFISLPSIRDRHVGYCKAVKESRSSLGSSVNIIDIPHDFQFAPVCPEEEHGIYLNAFEKIKSSGKGRKGVFCMTDYAALSFLKICLEMGADVPGEFGIIGLGKNYRVSPMKITIVTQDYFNIGYEACKMVVDWINSGVHNPQTKLLPPILEAGETTGGSGNVSMN